MKLQSFAVNFCRLASRFSAIILAVALLCSAMPPAAAQNMRIVAVVNDEMISGYELEQRMRLVAGGAPLPGGEQRNRLAAQVLRTMIDERLQLQEAKRLNVRVEQKEIDEALARLAKQNNIAPVQIAERLKSDGLNIETLEKQIEATIAWTKVVRRRAARFAVVAEDEIDDALARIKENANKPSHLLSQIFVSVDSPQDEAEALNNANRLFEELKQGASFPRLATQFSQDSSAREGGNMGWLQLGQLPQEIENVLVQMPVGSVSPPIRSAEGYHIIALRDRRAPIGGADDDVQLSLHQILVPIPAGTRPEEATSQRELAQTISETVRGCDDMDKAAKELGSSASGRSGMLRVGEMAADLRQTVLGLKVGQPSKPLPVEEGLRILMVCERNDPESNLPNRQEVQRMLREQKMEMQARRLLRDLRQTAFVDIRA